MSPSTRSRTPSPSSSRSPPPSFVRTDSTADGTTAPTSSMTSPLSSPTIELDRPDLSGSTARMYPIRTVKYPSSFTRTNTSSSAASIGEPTSPTLSSSLGSVRSLGRQRGDSISTRHSDGLAEENEEEEEDVVTPPIPGPTPSAATSGSASTARPVPLSSSAVRSLDHIGTVSSPPRPPATPDSTSVPSTPPSITTSEEGELYLTNRFTHQVNPEDGTTWVLTGREGQLQTCEDEPIHAPGAVQSFGVLVCFDEVGTGDDRTLKVCQASENSAQILQVTPTALFRLPSLLDLFAPSEQEIFLDALNSLDERDQDIDADEAGGLTAAESQKLDRGPLHFVITGGEEGRTAQVWEVHAAIHRPDRKKSPRRAIVEFELVEDVINPLRGPERSPSSTPRPKQGMAPLPTHSHESSSLDAPQIPVDPIQEPPPTEADLTLSTQSIVKPLRALARYKARRTSRRKESLDTVALLEQINEQFDKTEDLEVFLRVVAGVFRELTEFDRVMVYQFDESWNGRVVAEQVDWSKTTDLFRGLSFPASDIPAQARNLYKINKVRLLYDRDQPTARLCCRSLEEVENPLNMTHCHLRAMSPIHCVYLKNMGVRSSFSVSITAFGDLWGLVSMHTYAVEGTRVSFPARQLCRLLGDAISRNIERLSYHKRLYARKLINTAATEQNPTGYIVAKAEDLLTLFDADFGVLSIGDEAKILGNVSNSQELLAVVEYLRTQNLSAIVRTQDIRADFPDIDYSSSFELIAGFLVVPLSSIGRDFIVFFRKGQLQEVHWAGNPYANKTEGKNYRPLEPRKSFKLWSETIVGKCRAWTDEQVETAGVLCLIYGKFIAVWRQKESAIAANQLTNLLLANASHELRTPLNSIINYIELALDGPVDGEVRENLSRSHEASRSLIHVINDLLDLTRTERGKDLSLSDPFDLPATISDAVAMHKVEALRRGLTVDIIESPSGTPPTLLGDRGKVRQVIGNIVANAVKHTHKGGILIEWGELVDANLEDAVEKRQDSIRIGISITDTGSGISEDKLEQIFREFEQVSSVESQEIDTPQIQPVGSVGLGLAVVARIVKNLNGQLRVESQVDKGSKFQVVFPFRLPTALAIRSRPSSIQDESLEGSGTESSRTLSAIGAAERREPGTPLARTNSMGSEGSKGSKGSLTKSAASGASGKSEIQALIDDLSSSHMQSPTDVRRRRPHSVGSGGSRASHNSIRSVTSLPSGRVGAMVQEGGVEVPDPNVPLRATKIPAPFERAAEGSGISRRSSLSTSTPSSPSTSHQARLGDSSSGPGMTRTVSHDSGAHEIPSENVVASSSFHTVSPPRGSTPPHMSDYKKKNASPSTTLKNTLRILVVEDEMVNRLILQKRLKKEGHEVLVAEHGGEALRMFEADPALDLVLMDLQMPFVNGYEASAGIRALEAASGTPLVDRRPTTILNGRIPILAVSASLYESQRPDIAEAGMDGWLLKPVDSSRLFRLIDGTVDIAKRAEDLYQPGAWERGGWLEAAPGGRTKPSRRRSSARTDTPSSPLSSPTLPSSPSRLSSAVSPTLLSTPFVYSPTRPSS